MKISYDKEVDALNITFKEGTVKETMEIAPEVLLDVDSQDRPLYLEVIGLTEKFGKKAIKNINLKNLTFTLNKRALS